MKKILVIEDDLKIATALAIRLEAAGYQACTAANGADGLKRALEDRPDLIIMDIWMPIGLGFSVAQRLRQMGLSHIPFIFITASKLEGLAHSARGLGAVAFFEKPYDAEQLLQAVAAALESTSHPKQPAMAAALSC